MAEKEITEFDKCSHCGKQPKGSELMILKHSRCELCMIKNMKEQLDKLSQNKGESNWSVAKKIVEDWKARGG